MNHPTDQVPGRLTLITIREAAPATYSLETAARLVGVHPEMLRYYCRVGLIGEAHGEADAEPVFDDDAICELRRFERFRRQHGLDRRTLRLIFSLRREVERLQAELRFLRGR
jgi:DNA-binding transcriptional MerR regulator